MLTEEGLLEEGSVAVWTGGYWDYGAESMGEDMDRNWAILSSFSESRGPCPWYDSQCCPPCLCFSRALPYNLPRLSVLIAFLGSRTKGH